MWTNRSQHAEAMLNNNIGYLRIKPDPGLYRTANGIMDLGRRAQVADFLLKTIQRKVDVARIVFNYPGDLWVGITPKRPLVVDERNVDPGHDEWVTNSQAVDFLDWLGHQTVTIYRDPDEGEEVALSAGMPFEFSFQLEKWAPKDPESYATGARGDGITGGGFQMPR